MHCANISLARRHQSFLLRHVLRGFSPGSIQANRAFQTFSNNCILRQRIRQNRNFPRELSRALHLGFDQRQVNDYGDIWTVAQEEADAVFSDASLFVESIEAYLKNQ
jgi:hypothetical protein